MADDTNDGSEQGEKMIAPMTEKAFQEMISRTVNAAITARERRHAEKAMQAPVQAAKEEPEEEARTVSAVNSRVKRLEQQLAAKDAEATQLKKDSSLRAAMATAGIVHADLAMAVLEKRNCVVQGQDGSFVWRQKSDDGYEEDVVLDAGLKSWANGEGALFAAPKNSHGSGARQGRPTTTQRQGSSDPETRRNEQANALSELLGKG